MPLQRHELLFHVTDTSPVGVFAVHGTIVRLEWPTPRDEPFDAEANGAY